MVMMKEISKVNILELLMKWLKLLNIKKKDLGDGLRSVGMFSN